MSVKMLLSLAVLICLAAPYATAEEKEGNAGKPKVEKKAGKKEDEGRQGNPFTRFWIHTVGAPMARGMKDGMKTVHGGLRTGARKIHHAFQGGSEREEEEQNRSDKARKEDKNEEKKSE